MQRRGSVGARGGSGPAPWTVYVAVLLVTTVGGYLFGSFSTGLLKGTEHDLPGAASSQQQAHRQLRLETGARHAGGVSSSASSNSKSSRAAEEEAKKHKWPGDSIHSVTTSDNGPYNGFQQRIMYGTYKLVQKMPGGERLTGFTRILHGTTPDILMDEVPTFYTFPHRTDNPYPVANRPWAIKAFFDAAAKNESMIQGAWVFMLETDYVWLQPMKVPGSAYDPSVPGVQFLYDYIMPSHPNAAKEMRKLYKGAVTDIPPSGPAPVLLRTQDWHTMVDTYLKASVQMESDEEMKKSLAWVREMYAWDVACAVHKDTIKIRLEHPPNSTTIVQPPFDEGLFDAALAHYTWGALYHEGLPSKGAKQAYRWEKRDYGDIKHVLKVPNIPMPPEYKDGWILEFDAPLTRKRHDLVVVMLTQMNKAIDLLPDLNPKWQAYLEAAKGYERKRDEELPRHKEEADKAEAAILAAIKAEQEAAAAAASKQ